MQKIVPHLWFDDNAREAAAFYAKAFNGKVGKVNVIHNTPSGSVDIVPLSLFGQDFILISAGPYFKFNPSISFLVSCSSREELDGYWASLSEGGTALMPLGKYPFSEWFGWVQDKFGVSWQLILMDRQKRITPMLLFVGNVAGKAQAAMELYVSIFKNSSIVNIARHGPGGPEKPGTVMFGEFVLEGQHFAAMDSALGHNFSFNEAVSFLVRCNSQEEIDYYWGKLSAVPEAEQCGWLKDKFGVSWQVAPVILDSMLENKKKAQAVTTAFLKMKKFDLARLKEVYNEA